MIQEKNDMMINPKDLVAKGKVDFSVFPDIGHLYGAMACMNGAERYGPYNWREIPIHARVYIAAIERHLKAWKSGEEEADDSLIHHLGHIIACCAIILDAQLNEKLIDDRPKCLAFIESLKEANKKIAIRRGVD